MQPTPKQRTQPTFHLQEVYGEFVSYVPTPIPLTAQSSSEPNVGYERKWKEVQSILLYYFNIDITYDYVNADTLCTHIR